MALMNKFQAWISVSLFCTCKGLERSIQLFNMQIFRLNEEDTTLSVKIENFLYLS